MVIVTAAAIIMDGRLLIARRIEGEGTAGLWELPGGKLEPGETPEQCLKRELLEELGIEAEIGEKIGESPIVSAKAPMKLAAYVASIISGSPVASVHSELRFVTAEDLSGFEFCPADVPLIAAARRIMEEGLPDAEFKTAIG